MLNEIKVVWNRVENNVFPILTKSNTVEELKFDKGYSNFGAT
jgi:hypothetical protein